MKKSGLDRKEIFLETKLWPSFYEQEDAVEKTLQRLDTDYIDLLLIHQPIRKAKCGPSDCRILQRHRSGKF